MIYDAFVEFCGLGGKPRELQKFCGSFRTKAEARAVAIRECRDGNFDFAMVFASRNGSATGRLVWDSRIPDQDPRKVPYQWGAPVLERQSEADSR